MFGTPFRLLWRVRELIRPEILNIRIRGRAGIKPPRESWRKERVRSESHGRVAKLLAGDECGFIETAEVRFVEEEGAKGAQASTVRLIGKHHLV